MAKKAKKRYIVSYTQEKADVNQAAAVLGVEMANLQDAVAVLSTERSEAEVAGDCLHFESLGTTVLPLSEKEVKDLQHDDRVAEVVEDFEVFALGFHEEPSSASNQGWSHWEAGGSAQRSWYMAGYRQALLDMHSGRTGMRTDTPETPQPCCPPEYHCVCRCEPIVAPAPPTQPIPWNIELVKANLVWERVTGQGVKVAILDTGIDEDHPDLTVSGGMSFVPGVVSWDDDQGHGTHCAGITGARNNPVGVVGVAPECSIYAVKVLNSSGSGQLSWILAGMDWARQNGMQVASMSLGSNVSTPDATCNVAYQRAAQALVDAGCIVVAAAGNNGRASNPWVGQPARCPGYMAVAAIDKDKNLATFSSRGPDDLCSECGVEISAPGVRVRSTVPGGGYRELSGTSMACPHVSGAAALLKELRPTWTPAQIRARLKATASDLGAPGNDPEFGAGLLDCQQAVFG